MPEQLLKYFPLVKVDEKEHRVYGVATSEAIDSDGEICDYDGAKKAFEKWSGDFLKRTSTAGQEPSMGNIRLQHSMEIGGKATKVDFNDETKQIWLESEPISDTVWDQLRRGFYSGYSLAGSYDWRKCADCGEAIPASERNNCPNCKKKVTVRYAPVLAETSYVDNPSNPEASFSYVKADGSMEVRKFTKPPAAPAQEEKTAMPVAKADKKTKRVAGEDLPASAFLIVGDKSDPSTWKLPVAFSSDAKSKRHIRNALARFSQLKDVAEDVKSKAWRKLVRLAEEHGIDVDENSKTAKPELRKDMWQVAMLSDLLERIRSLQVSCLWEAEIENDVMDDEMADRFGEWLETGVAILKILVEEETSELTAAAAIHKGESMTEADLLKSSRKSLAAHFKKAAAHHEKMAEHHEDMAKAHMAKAEHHATGMGKADGDEGHKASHAFHKAMGAHHEKCDKAHSAHAEHCLKMAESSAEEPTDKAAAAGAPAPVVAIDAAAAAKAAADAEAAAKAAAGTGDDQTSDFQKNLQELVQKRTATALSEALDRIGNSEQFKRSIDDVVAAQIAEKLGGTIKPDGVKLAGAGLTLVPRAGEQILEKGASDSVGFDWQN